MKERKFVIAVFAVVLTVASLNVVSIVNGMNDSSYESYAMGSKCSAQGAMVAQPFDELIVSPDLPNETDEYFSTTEINKPSSDWNETIATSTSN